MSDSDGTIVDTDGINNDKLAWVMELKNVRRGRIREYVDHFKGAKYLAGKRPWGVPCDLAFPSATQNEVDEDDARQLVKNGCYCVSEGANMPSRPEAVDVFLERQDPVRTGQGRQCRRGGGVGPGDESELRVHAAVPRRRRCPVVHDHALHP